MELGAECNGGGSGHKVAEVDDGVKTFCDGSEAIGSALSTLTPGLLPGVMVLPEVSTGRRTTSVALLYGSSLLAAAPSQPKSNKSVSM